jgi:hypothetical protein
MFLSSGAVILGRKAFIYILFMGHAFDRQSMGNSTNIKRAQCKKKSNIFVIQHIILEKAILRTNFYN